jgi:hypothetical protein
MKRLNRHTKTGAVAGAGRGEGTSAWYFARLALLAVPWEARNKRTAKGTLFTQYHLIRARNISSAFDKAEQILALSENRKGAGKLNGHRVDYKRVGILDLEPLYQKLASGVELFDESKQHVSFSSICRRVLSADRRLEMIEYEKMKGKPPLLDVFWGKKFDKL